MPFLYRFTLPGNNRGTGGEMAEGYYLSLICIELNNLLTHVLICPYFSEVMPFIDGTSHLISYSSAIQIDQLSCTYKFADLSLQGSSGDLKHCFWHIVLLRIMQDMYINKKACMNLS